MNALAFTARALYCLIMIKRITSFQNEAIKSIRALKHKKNREGQFALIEGSTCVSEAIASHVLIETIVISEDKENTYLPLINQIDDRADILIVPREIIERISSMSTCQGILAKCVIHFETDLSKLVVDNKLVLILEHVQDPGNVGTMIRTADAVEAGAVILTADTADPMNEKVIRASMGSVFHLPVIIAPNIKKVIEALHHNNYHILCGDLQGKDYYSQTFICDRLALIIGNEGHGISEFVRKQADYCLKLPMWGNAESLNASVAAGILLYDLKHKLME